MAACCQQVKIERRSLPWLAGVDGCSRGWLVVLLHSSGTQVRIPGVVRDFSAVIDLPEHPAIVAVDMPIGLPERIGLDGRGPEAAVRKILKLRQRAGVPIPSPKAAH